MPINTVFLSVFLSEDRNIFDVNLFSTLQAYEFNESNKKLISEVPVISHFSCQRGDSRPTNSSFPVLPFLIGIMDYHIRAQTCMLLRAYVYITLLSPFWLWKLNFSLSSTYSTVFLLQFLFFLANLAWDFLMNQIKEERELESPSQCSLPEKLIR